MMQRRQTYKTKWKDEFLIIATHLARDGLTEFQIAKALGISKPTFMNWEDKKPLFKMAIEQGRSYVKRKRNGQFDLSDYIYRRLSLKSKKAWRRIDAVDKKNGKKSKVNAIMASCGKRVRQDLFRCALVQGLFNIAAACRKTGIGRNTFERWKKDKFFARMIWEIEEIKKDMFEDTLTRLALAGDSAVNIHLANTKLKDRGYSKNIQMDVNVTGQIDHNHHVVLMEDLGLSLNVQKTILKKVREQRKLVESTVVEEAE